MPPPHTRSHLAHPKRSENRQAPPAPARDTDTGHRRRPRGRSRAAIRTPDDRTGAHSSRARRSFSSCRRRAWCAFVIIRVDCPCAKAQHNCALPTKSGNFTAVHQSGSTRGSEAGTKHTRSLGVAVAIVALQIRAVIVPIWPSGSVRQPMTVRATRHRFNACRAEPGENAGYKYRRGGVNTTLSRTFL